MSRRLLGALLVGAALAVPVRPVAARAAGAPGCLRVTVAAVPVGAIPAGTPVHLRAVAHCRPRSHPRFAFFVRAGTVGRFVLLRGWGRAALRWRTASDWPGTWRVALWVRAGSGPGVTAAAGLSVTLTDGIAGRPRPGAGARSRLNPAANVGLGPDFRRVCAEAGSGSPRCRAAVLAAIDRARGAEGLPALQLPLAVERLTPAELLLVLTDEERIARGLAPVLGLSPGLDGVAAAAARRGADVGVPAAAGPDRVVQGGTTWARDLGPLAALYDWMYEDGAGPVNLDCPTPGGPGCWGHRDTILRREPAGPSVWLVMGAAQARWPLTGGVSDVEIVAAVRGPRPPLLFTWAEATRLGF